MSERVIPTVCPACGSQEIEGGDERLYSCGNENCQASLESQCHICERPIEPGGDLPLCPPCKGAAQAHGRLMAEAQRQKREEVYR